jgi:septal ring factor EnvC (AmiA/AmiB activator)
MTALVRRDRRDDEEIEGLRKTIETLEGELARRERDLIQAQAELDVFKARYRHAVGTLYEQLDRLEEAIAEAELGELAADVGDTKRRAPDPPPAPPASSPRFTSDAIRKLFRDVAKAIHPDLTNDELARRSRQALMAEANRAYADGDEAQLRMILESWARSPEAVPGSDPAAIRLRLMRRIAQLEERLGAVEAEILELQASPLAELKSKVDDAAANGRDLVAELVRRLEREVLIATNRLAAMRPFD